MKRRLKMGVALCAAWVVLHGCSGGLSGPGTSTTTGCGSGGGGNGTPYDPCTDSRYAFMNFGTAATCYSTIPSTYGTPEIRQTVNGFDVTVIWAENEPIAGQARLLERKLTFLLPNLNGGSHDLSSIPLTYTERLEGGLPERIWRATAGRLTLQSCSGGGPLLDANNVVLTVVQSELGPECGEFTGRITGRL